MVKFVEAMISSTLTTVRVELTPDNFTTQEGEEDAVVSALAKAIRTRIPDNRLKHLAIMAMFSITISAQTLGDLAHLIESQATIQTLSLDIPSPGVVRVFNAASRLQSLNHGVLSLPGKSSVPHSLGFVSGGFRALRSLKLDTDGPQLLEFVSSTNSPALKSISIATPWRYWSHISRLPTLKSIKIVLRFDDLHWEDCQPILSLPLIQSLDIILYEGENLLSDDNMWKMARAWPNLRTLSIQADKSQPKRALLTLRGLQCFGRFCPNLTSLHLSVDARGITTEGPAYVASSLRRLDLGSSLLNEESVAAVAKFIAKAWPNHEGDVVSWDRYGEKASIWSNVKKELYRLLSGPEAGQEE